MFTCRSGIVLISPPTGLETCGTSIWYFGFRYDTDMILTKYRGIDSDIDV